MLYGIRFKTYKADGEEYSTRFGFFNDLMDAKKQAIKLFKSSPHIARVEAIDVESGKVIKHVPDARGGIREGGGRTSFDGQPRTHRMTLRVAQDVWDIISSSSDKSEYIHRAVRFYKQHNNGTTD